MRWFLPGVIATILALAACDMAQACGCCGPTCPCPSCPCSGGDACPNCPGGKSCPNCPGRTATVGDSRYWSSAYGCYLYYDPATRLSYYWSEADRSYVPVQTQLSAAPIRAAGTAAPASPSSISTTQYYSPDAAPEAAAPAGHGR